MKIIATELVSRELKHSVVAFLQKTPPKTMSRYNFRIDNYQVALVKHQETGQYAVYCKDRQYTRTAQLDKYASRYHVSDLVVVDDGEWQHHGFSWDRLGVQGFYSRFYVKALKPNTKWQIIQKMPKDMKEELDMKRFCRKLGAG